MSSIVDYTISSLAAFYTGTAIHNAPKHTGRLPLSDAEEKTSVPKAVLYAPEPGMVPEELSERIFHRHSSNPLNTVFFGESNMANLQTKIKQTVAGMSGSKNYQIDDQSEDDLKTVMRSYYLQYAKNDPTRVAEELAELNDRVVGFCANRIMVEIEAYVYYRKDIMDFPAPIERPIDSHIFGTRTGELKRFF
jgi:hypothetical protein